MSDYKLTRDAAGNVTTQYSQMLERLEDDPLNYLTLDTDELGIWLIDDTPEGPQQLGHISWGAITRGVQQALLQEKFLIALAEIDKEKLKDAE